MVEKNRIWTVPNILSLLRLCMVVPILICLSREQRIWALVWMLAGLATDFLDGYVARRFDQRSDLGRIIDPIVDKISILVVTFYMVISPVYGFPLWFFVFILARELILMVCSSLVIKKKDIVMESNRPGKNSAFAIGVVVILFVLGLQPYGWIVLWIAFILTLYSSYVYLRLFLKQLKQKSST